MISQGIYSGTKESVLSRVLEVEIASMYIPQLKEIPSVINSPLREDKHPSFRIYSPDGVKVKFYDYATCESGGIIDLVMRIFNCSFSQALERIDLDTKNHKPTLPVRTSNNSGIIKIRSEYLAFQIRSQRREWEEYDFEYWDSYGVPKNWLLHADIYPISYIFIVSETGYIKTLKADKYAYTFIERKDGRITEKVYQPFNKEGMKWRSGHDASVWDLWTKLPSTGEKCIITSSRKDALCIWAQTGIPAVSLQSETTSIKPQVIQELKDRFKKVFVLYDNDFNSEINHGRIDGIKIAEAFNIEQIEIPSGLQSKDVSDLYHNHGGDTVRKIIYALTQRTL